MSRIENPFDDIIFDSIINPDVTLMTSLVKPSLPSEEISTRASDDLDALESCYEIDVSDIDMTLYADQFFNEQTITDFFNEFKPDEPISGSNSTMNHASDVVLTETSGVCPATETQDIADTIQNSNDELAMIQSKNTSLTVVRPLIEKLPITGHSDNSISLSKSVNVTVPKPNQLQLIYPLEDTFRPRYKSDYFPQNGAVRRPRYVADNAKNHFITLQMPSEYHRDLRNEYIRVALITTASNDRGHFYSPYKFQTNHDDVKVPDQNPIYVPIQVHQDSDFRMKLHLVLIKSKLDQLYDAQPLKPFKDTFGEIQNLIHEEKLTSKDLINTYQLDKSHLAFTLCTKLPNGLYHIHSETTVISTVITEVSKTSTTANTTSEPIAESIGSTISCPNCQHCFDPTAANVMKNGNKRKSNADATSSTNAKTPTPKRTYKKKNSIKN